MNNAHPGPVVDAASAQAYLAWHSPQATAARNKAAAEAYKKSPKGLAEQKAKDDKAAAMKSAYEKGGDKGLADWMLNGGAKMKGEMNQALAVSKGKSTYKQFAQESKDNYMNAINNQKQGQVIGAYSNPYEFALNDSSQSKKPAATPAVDPQKAKAPEVSAAPVNEDTTGKFPWQKAKEKANTYKANQDYVNSYKGTGGFNSSWKGIEDKSYKGKEGGFNQSNYSYNTQAFNPN